VGSHGYLSIREEQRQLHTTRHSEVKYVETRSNFDRGRDTDSIATLEDMHGILLLCREQLVKAAYLRRYSIEELKHRIRTVTALVAQLVDNPVRAFLTEASLPYLITLMLSYIPIDLRLIPLCHRACHRFSPRLS
jgi:hypothetical protein